MKPALRLFSLFRKPFYGWWIVAGAVVSQFTWMGIGPTVVGVFLRPIVDELGWQVWQFTLATSRPPRSRSTGWATWLPKSSEATAYSGSTRGCWWQQHT